LVGVVLVAGCGSGMREAAPKECVVRVFFCTADICGRPATREQINQVTARLSGREDVYSVTFVSKEEALEIMRKRNPGMVERLPTNPLLPPSLRVRPLEGSDPAAIAAAVPARHAGVHKVDYRALGECG
jgi:cell division protein FtsX